MPVLIGGIEELGLNCLIFTGRVSGDELLEFPEKSARSKYIHGTEWIAYFDPRADLSEVSAADLFDLKAQMAAVICAYHDAGDLNVLLLSSSKENDVIAESWWTLVSTDPDYPSNPLYAKDFKAAADVFGLTALQCELAERWIEQEIAAEASRRT